MGELERFALKADSYKRALNRFPDARILEVYPIIDVINSHCRWHSIRDAKNLKIVDLMAGSGFLTRLLQKAGFRNIHSIELCPEMAQNSRVWDLQGVTFVPVTSLEDLSLQLNKINPDIIISLASFHHLIVYNDENELNLERSIDQQIHVINMAMQSLRPKGLLMIADLAEPDAISTEITYKGINTLSKTSCDMKKIGLQEWLCPRVRDYDSYRDFSNFLKEKIPPPSTYTSLQWFRNVIDSQTSIGHKDIALHNRLLERLRTGKYYYSFSHYYCPWLFYNQFDAKEFLYNKFGFAANEENMLLSDDQVFDLAERRLGIINSNNLVFLNWDLALLSVHKVKPGKNIPSTSTVVFCLAAMNVVMLAVNLFKLDFRSDAGKAAETFLTILLGMLINEFINIVSRGESS